MGVTDNPVGKVDQAVKALDGLERPLDTGHEVKDRPDHANLRGKRGVKPAPVAAHGHPDIGQEG